MHNTMDNVQTNAFKKGNASSNNEIFNGQWTCIVNLMYIHTYIHTYIHIYRSHFGSRFRVKVSPTVVPCHPLTSAAYANLCRGQQVLALLGSSFWPVIIWFSIFVVPFTPIFGLILFGVPEPQNTRVLAKHPLPFLNWSNPGICLWISTLLCIT